jgi:hypothetical protein
MLRRMSLEDLRSAAAGGIASTGDPLADLVLGIEGPDEPQEPMRFELSDGEGGARPALFGMAAALEDERRGKEFGRTVNQPYSYGFHPSPPSPLDPAGFNKLASDITDRILAKAAGATSTHLRKVTLRDYLKRMRAKGENLRHLILACAEEIRPELTEIATAEGWLQ